MPDIKNSVLHITIARQTELVVAPWLSAQPSRSSGTGFVTTMPNGQLALVTCAHVVYRASKIMIKKSND